MLCTEPAAATTTSAPILKGWPAGAQTTSNLRDVAENSIAEDGQRCDGGGQNTNY
jgi:hypothetical protein